MRAKDYVPLIMWICLAAGIIACAIHGPGRTTGIWDASPLDFDTVFICLYILWMLIELRISGKDANTEGKNTSDSATCQLYGLGQALTVLSALWFPSAWRAPNAAHLAGMSVFILGLCYRLWAIRTLGRFYSHRVRTVAQHRIIDSGPYRYTRHPAYAGMIIAHAGLSLYFLNWVTMGVFFFLLLPAILLRIRTEERTLFRIEGYSEFARKRKRLFPALW